MSRWGELIRHMEDDPACLCGCQDEETEVTRSVEIPEAGETAAFEALRAHDDASYWNSCACHCGATFETIDLLHRHIANSVLAAALPYLAPAAKCTCDPGPEGQHRYWCATSGYTAADEEREYMALAPSGDGGLREALEELAKERDSVNGATPSDYVIAPYELRELLAAHPAAPAVPQPVDREAPTPDAIAISLFNHDQETFGYQMAWEEAGVRRQAVYLDRANAVLALLAGEQEQVEP